MSDNRPRVTVTKPVNLEQLTAEVGAPLAATVAADQVTVLAVVVADPNASVTQAQLQDAVDAHVAQPTTLERAAELQAKASAALDGNATFLSLASPTAKQVSDQAKALTRQTNALIRLVIGKLDTTTGT